MTGFLLDTHIWIWYVEGSPRLPPGLRRLLDRSAGDRWLSPISVWETGLPVERGRLRLALPLPEWIASARHALPLREAPVTEEVVLAALQLQLPHRDAADRFLAATALVRRLTLLTLDERMMHVRGLVTRSR
jgi:PIN domain nuclease of toxin-antitoxin system